MGIPSNTGNMFVRTLLISISLAAYCKGQCQQPGNALCWYQDLDLEVGGPCCAGSACFPHPSDSTDSWCQYLAKIPEGGDCGNKVGVCVDGCTCINDVCTKGTAIPTEPTAIPTEPTAIPTEPTVPTIPITDNCVDDGGICFSIAANITDMLECCDTNACLNLPADPAGTYKCQALCIDLDATCYDPATSVALTDCCGDHLACTPGTGTAFTCQSVCAPTGKYCFSLAKPDADKLDCCKKEDECTPPADADLLTADFTCETKKDCAVDDDLCYDLATNEIKQCCTAGATCSVEVSGEGYTCSA